MKIRELTIVRGVVEEYTGYNLSQPTNNKVGARSLNLYCVTAQKLVPWARQEDIAEAIGRSRGSIVHCFREHVHGMHITEADIKQVCETYNRLMAPQSGNFLERSEAN